MSATLRTLVAARALIEKPEQWITGDYWDDSRGFSCYCAIGAVNEADPNAPEFGIDTPAALSLAHALGADERADVERWNDLDTTTHADVLALFDRAIAAERAKAGEQS